MCTATVNPKNKILVIIITGINIPFDYLSKHLLTAEKWAPLTLNIKIINTKMPKTTIWTR